MTPAPTSGEILTFEEFEAHLRTRELFRQGVKVRLPDQSFRVLAMLLERSGELVTREEIHQRLWPADTFVDFDHGLNNAVNRLREALGDSADSPRWIETLPRRGYRFIGTGNDAEAHPAEADPEQNAPDVVSVQGAEVPKGRRYRRLLWAVPVIAGLALLIAFELQKTAAVPSSRAFVLPPEDTRFKLIGDDGGPPALSADGAKLAFVAVDSKGKALVWVRSLGKLTADPIEGTEGAAFPFWSPDGHSIAFFADGKLKKVSLEGGAAVVLCDASSPRGGSWGQRGVIVFTPTTHSGIYQISESGGESTPVTNVDTSIHTTHRWPRFLPDGFHFIYMAASHHRGASHNGIYLGSLDGRETKLLIPSDADATYASGYLFFLSNSVLMAQRFDARRARLLGEPRPTLERVLFDPSIWKAVFDASENGVMAYQLGASVSGPQLRWFDRSGKQLSVLGEPGFQFTPRLSPDGRRLAAGGAAPRGAYSDLWVYDVVRGFRTRITFNDSDNGAPIWSHDGTQVLFTGKREHYNIYRVDSSGARSEQLVLDTGIDTWPLDLSSDGRFLLYGQGFGVERARSQLWLHEINGTTKPFRLLEGKNKEDNGRFSPDGRWLAYISNESGRNQVYVISFHLPLSSSATSRGINGKWQISVSGGNFPSWRRDGKELFYMAEDNTLMAVPVNARGSKLEIGTAHPLFRTNPSLLTYDVSPDGSRFIVLTAAPETTAPITLVENWLSDFKK